MYPDLTCLLVTEKYGNTQKVKMKIQYQYAAEIHPDVDGGKRHLCGNTWYFLKLELTLWKLNTSWLKVMN